MSKPLSSMTNGWRDLDVLTVLNGMGGFVMRCGLTFAAKFDGKKYKLSRILAVDVDQNAESTPRQYRRQAEKIIRGK